LKTPNRRDGKMPFRDRQTDIHVQTSLYHNNERWTYNKNDLSSCDSWEDFLKFVTAFSELFPLENKRCNLNPHYSLGIFVHIWYNMAVWFWRGSWKCEKFTERRTHWQTMDNMISERFPWAFILIKSSKNYDIWRVHINQTKSKTIFFQFDENYVWDPSYFQQSWRTRITVT
jgi:hypothetical protein